VLAGFRFENLQERDHLEDFIRVCKIILKIDLKNIDWEIVNGIHLSRDKDSGQ
jgi:hypothetical protein